MAVQCLNYFYDGEAEQFSFYRIPKVLFTDKRFHTLSIEGKALYGLMLDRMGLSKKNGWADSAGRIYINFKLEDAIQLLCLSKNKVIKVYKELIDIGLIERVKQGQGRPAIIYVKNFVTRENESDYAATYVSNPQTANNGTRQDSPGATAEELKYGDSRIPCGGSSDFPKREVKTSLLEESRLPQSGSADFPDMDLNNTKISNTEISYTNQSIIPCAGSRTERGNLTSGKEDADRYDYYRKRIKENIDYEYLQQRHGTDIDIIDGYIDLMADICCSHRESISINGGQVATGEAKRRFLKLTSEHILYVLERMSNTTTAIHNIKSYTLTALYNAPATMAQYYSSLVAHDMAGEFT